MYGLTHGIVTTEQYSYLVAAVIASAVVPTVVANYAFLPRHLVPEIPEMSEGPPSIEPLPEPSVEAEEEGLADE